MQSFNCAVYILMFLMFGIRKQKKKGIINEEILISEI
jgi:hypothetical protein